ncbi:Telo_bind domain-containing protein [Cephalotus follicularis]|uniref:Telo_bind domain-containing protein n=1 Tax=Cephalotus follicularis TaxID=3775 RepID=A0A1Q3CLV4_CEPFO|nr:Telo_bind domain-containing protein [Cephalotus follicularis]
MEDKDDYKFLKIRDAIASINQRLSIIGVILEFGLPRKTKCSDCSCTLKIIDESHQKPGISVNVFTENMDKLPHIASTGDIILLSHVMIKTHNGEVCVVYNKKFSSFALYKGKHGEDFLPYQISPRFCLREQDKKFIAGLRKWMLEFKLDEGSSNFFMLREIKEGVRVNLACKLLHIWEIAQDEWMAFVWDGTDTPPTSICTKLEDEMYNQLPLHLEPLPLSRDILRTFPVVGTILRVIIDHSIQKHILHLLKADTWVKLLNVLCEVNGGLWYGVLTPFTKLRYMSNEDHLLKDCQRIYDARLSLTLGRMPYWSFPRPSLITEVCDEHTVFGTLIDVLTNSKVTNIFNCVVRVVAAFPWRAEDFCSPLGMYRMRLTLEDPTARIHAFVYADDGEKFFDGYPSVDILTRKRNKLLGVAVSNDGKEIKNAHRNPPWMQCCLKSYRIVRNDIWGSRCYRIYGTKLLG